MKFYPSLRLEFKRYDWIKKGDTPIGQIIKAKTIKNRFNAPYLVTEISLIFGEGIDQVIEAVDVAVTKGIIKQGGAWFSFEDSNKDPQKLQGRERVYEFFREDKEFNYLKSLLAQQSTTESTQQLTDTKEESDD